MELINKKENVFGDGIAFVEQYDFSRANLSQEHRIHAISAVASICYQNPKAIGSESLYNRLMAESMGLPSSSFEMCPVLINEEVLQYLFLEENINYNILKFGEFIEDIPVKDYTTGRYLLTNYRALVYDVEQGNLDKEWLTYFNTEEECEIIKEHFKVFLFKVDFPTRSQMVRHRISWQELSRRYVSAKRVPFEFYVSEKMKDIKSTHEIITVSGFGEFTKFTTEDVINISLEHYYKALEAGVKPQEARRIIPQAAYTQIWGAFMPKQLDNFFKLRLDKHAQWEIQQIAIAMQELINGRK